MSSVSRSYAASERGPGIGVTMWGMDMWSPCEVSVIRDQVDAPDRCHEQCTRCLWPQRPGTSPNSFYLLALFLQPITHTPDGFDKSWMGGVVVELGPKPADVDINRAAIAVEIIAPHVLEELFAREDHARPPRQLDQEIVFLGPERDRLAIELDLSLGGVDGESAEVKQGRRLIGGGGSARTAQDGLDARDQLARHERLGDIIVGSDLQADDLVLIALAGREHD